MKHLLVLTWKISLRRPGFVPQSMLDLGSGIGTVSWYAASLRGLALLSSDALASFRGLVCCVYDGLSFALSQCRAAKALWPGLRRVVAVEPAEAMRNLAQELAGSLFAEQGTAGGACAIAVDLQRVLAKTNNVHR